VTPSTAPGTRTSEDPSNDRQFDVTVSAPVSTSFRRLLGIRTITATRASKAILPRDRPEARTSAHGDDGASSRHLPGRATNHMRTARAGSRHAEAEAFESRLRS
jgi:hypothetical protein